MDNFRRSGEDKPLITLPRRVAALALVALGVSTIISPAVAQSTPGLPPGYDKSMPAPGRYEAKLDNLLKAQEYERLFQAAVVDVDDMQQAERGLNWLRAKQLGQGGGTLVAFLYSALLWRVAGSHDEPEKTGLRQSAIAQFFVLRMMIFSERSQCADASSPAARMDIVDAALEEIGEASLALSQDDKNHVARLALGRVVATFKDRENDVWLCNGGAALFAEYFARHPDEQGTEVHRPGEIGRTIVLPHDPSILPGFVPYQDWKSERHAALDKIAQDIGEKRLDNYGDARHRMK